jgi:hypothetical protein
MCTKLFSDHAADLIIGLSGGVSAGIGIWFLDRAREGYLFWRDEKRIIKFFEEPEHQKEGWDFFSTVRIASYVNLTLERVNFVCSYSKKISRNQKDKELWTRNL